MKRILLFIGIFILIYTTSVIVINLPSKTIQTSEPVSVPTETASPSGQIEIPSVIPNL